MSRSLVLMGGVAAGLGAAGLALLIRPALGRRAFGIAESEPATYALRIAGMMLAAAGLLLGGFATLFHLAGAAGS